MSENPNVDERTPETPVVLSELGSSLLEEADAADNGRAAVTLTPTVGGPLKQTLIALRAGNDLSEDTDPPGPTTLQLLTGAATLVHDGEETAVPAGSWITIPASPHAVRAEEDTIALLTVVPNP